MNHKLYIVLASNTCVPCPESRVGVEIVQCLWKRGTQAMKTTIKTGVWITELMGREYNHILTLELPRSDSDTRQIFLKLQ